MIRNESITGGYFYLQHQNFQLLWKFQVANTAGSYPLELLQPSP